MLPVFSLLTASISWCSEHKTAHLIAPTDEGLCVVSFSVCHVFYFGTGTEVPDPRGSGECRFERNVKDIHSVLEGTVYDEDKHSSLDFLVKVEILLLRVKKGRKFYTLKEKKL
ncbi:uncharacterized protein LOC110987420 [Acanthaster planci]|uniref:Uncharacterized protein LOC110987420 n=1 Tax=Acanthaster planci TaxID=133434 RepID=A0A8B7ZQX3_ACAPL|nr:uncharacterized protein LOC110987420 [Acanthaster planci]